MAAGPHTPPAVEPSLREAVLTLARGYDFEEGHALQDERLALRLFDELLRLGLLDLAPVLQFPTPSSPGLPAGEITARAILSCAALLHDIGYMEGYEQHHKTAFRLILAATIPGLSSRIQALVAHVARYHRGGKPDPVAHGAFGRLSDDDQRLVTQLGAILRFADGLDRSHTDAVQDLSCQLDGSRLRVTLQPGVGDEAERWAGQKKARWFEAVFGVRVILT